MEKKSLAQSQLDNKSVNIQTFDVEIGGIHLRLKSSHSKETVDKIAELVNSNIQKTMQASKTDSLQIAAILTCLNLVEENLMFKKKALHELKLVESKAQEIVANLESTRTPQVGLDV